MWPIIILRAAVSREKGGSKWLSSARHPRNFGRTARISPVSEQIGILQE
jgi:hypothetical protein